MTNYQKAKEIAETGMKSHDVFDFFDKANMSNADYMALFSQFGICQNKVWDMYEDWQES